ncbi:receptor-interacting serine/threonine-protein kinase 4-like [Conger conger]|uniref:receptor-interacting serine/threonine-protein kinase 4-like n=1 Tax=Conger conger TaxID=82655 RepID=UPI002A5A6D46|nr:receptor-interacting serine/threonine-protein kinase 4-like [Conger conger]
MPFGGLAGLKERFLKPGAEEVKCTMGDSLGTLQNSSASLLKEAEFMQQGGSLYVVRVFGVYRGVPPGRGHSSQMGLVMELMERGSVESLLKRLGGPPPWPLAFPSGSSEMQHFGLVEDCTLPDWSVIGSGGFGQIYKAKHKDLGMEVAIKLLNYDDGSSASLLKEAEFMRQGGSPYVVRIFGVYRGVPPGRGLSCQMGLVMELMERGSVESLLKRLRGPPPWPLAFRLAHQVALGMNFLHKLCPPLLHLDLKPSNVLLDHGFGAKITDFGLARVMRSISSVGERGEDGGTLPYMPPEAFASDWAYKATPASDSYSYAILLSSIITGRKPYGDAALGRIRFRVPEGYRPSLEGVNRAAVEGLGEIIDLMERCWDPSPQKRPSFHDCLPVTEKVFELHSRGIHDAIHQVSKALFEIWLIPEKSNLKELNNNGPVALT